jgi:hypothetical protein
MCLRHRRRLVAVEVEQRHPRHLVGLAEVLDDRRRDRSRGAQNRHSHLGFSHPAGPYRARLRHFV